MKFKLVAILFMSVRLFAADVFVNKVDVKMLRQMGMVGVSPMLPDAIAQVFVSHLSSDTKAVKVSMKYQVESSTYSDSQICSVNSGGATTFFQIPSVTAKINSVIIEELKPSHSQEVLIEN